MQQGRSRCSGFFVSAAILRGNKKRGWTAWKSSAAILFRQLLVNGSYKVTPGQNGFNFTLASQAVTVNFAGEPSWPLRTRCHDHGN